MPPKQLHARFRVASLEHRKTSTNIGFALKMKLPKVEVMDPGSLPLARQGREELVCQLHLRWHSSCCSLPTTPPCGRTTGMPYAHLPSLR